MFQEGFTRFQQISSNVPMTFQQGFRYHQASMQEGSRTVLAMFQQDFSDFTARFQQGLTSLPAIFQRRSSKAPVLFRAFCWHHSPPQRLKPNRIAVGKFQQGCSNVAARLQEGSSKVPARFHARFQEGYKQGSSKVGERFHGAKFQQGSRKVPASSNKIASKVPAKFQQRSSKVSRKVQERFQQGSSKVPRKGGSSKVPGRFQQGSSKVALNSCKHVCRSLLLFKCVGCINIFLNCEKVHTVVAGSRFPSPNVKKTPCSDHFSKLTCRKSAHGCGVKHISKSKVLDFQMLFCVAGAKECAPCQK